MTVAKGKKRYLGCFKLAVGVRGYFLTPPPALDDGFKLHLKLGTPLSSLVWTDRLMQVNDGCHHLRQLQMITVKVMSWNYHSEAFYDNKRQKMIKSVFGPQSCLWHRWWCRHLWSCAFCRSLEMSSIFACSFFFLCSGGRWEKSSAAAGYTHTHTHKPHKTLNIHNNYSKHNVNNNLINALHHQMSLLLVSI